MTTPTPNDIVRERGGSTGGTFRRTWLMPLHDTAEHIIRDIAHPMHAANLGELARDAVARGLRPTGEPAVAEIEPHADGATVAVTYALPAAPTVAAANITSPPAEPAVPEPAIVPESTVEDTPAVEAPVPAAPVEQVVHDDETAG